MLISDCSSVVCSTDLEGRLTAVSCYAGHFTSQAMSATPDDIPVLGEWVAGVGSALHFAPGGHAAKALVHVIGQLPRRSEERSEGKECVSTSRSRWATHH